MTKEQKKVRNAKYWKQRFSTLENAQNQYGQKTFHQIEPSFDKAQRQIQSQIETWYQRYADNNGITLAEARKQLSAAELKELKWDVQEYIKYGQENALNQQWMKELENASARYHISRLEALKLRTQQSLEVAYGNELDSIDKMMKDLYQSGYYHTCYELQKGFNIGWEIGQIDERKLQKVITRPWTTDGKTFSDRIWSSKTQMIGDLHQQLTRTIIQGKAPDEAIKSMTKYVQDKTKNAKYQAGRLVMTEQAYISSAAQKDAFNDLDVEEFEIVATLDSHTSEICQEMDGQHFPMKDFQPGVTAPPFHVWCRSTTVPYFDDEWSFADAKHKGRIARDADGNTYYVDSDMTYSEWKDSLVDGNVEDLTPVDTSDFSKNTIKASKKDIKTDADGLTKVSSDDTIKLSNSEVRKRYIEEVSTIKDSIDSGLPIEEQAKQAFEKRNAIRTKARSMMADEETRKLLEAEHPNKTFEELVKSKMDRKGMTREEAIQDVYDTATKTNANINKELGLGGD